MPSIAGHMAVAKLVSEKLNINDLNFIKGNLLPDIILKPDSHHQVKGTYFMVPSLEYFREKLDLTNNIHLGYFVHILLDYYFLEEFVPNNITDLNIFANGTMYKEYDKVNYQLVKRFNLDVKNLKAILSNFDEEIDNQKLAYNLECLSLSIIEETEYLNFDSFANFLNKILDIIIMEIKKY